MSQTITLNVNLAMGIGILSAFGMLTVIGLTLARITKLLIDVKRNQDRTAHDITRLIPVVLDGKTNEVRSIAVQDHKLIEQIKMIRDKLVILSKDPAALRHQDTQQWFDFDWNLAVLYSAQERMKEMVVAETARQEVRPLFSQLQSDKQ